MGRKPSQQEILERRLRTALQRDCPSPMQLGEYRMGLLDGTEEEQVRLHLRACGLCQDEVAQLNDFMMECDEEAPSLWSEIKEVVVEWGRSMAQPRAGLAGIRGAAVKAQTFSTEHLWMAVTVQDDTEPDKKTVLALVTREDGCPLEHGTAWLSQEHKLVMGGRIDGAGNLVIRGVPAGQYDLGIQCDGTRVWVRGVSV